MTNPVRGGNEATEVVTVADLPRIKAAPSTEAVGEVRLRDEWKAWQQRLLEAAGSESSHWIPRTEGEKLRLAVVEAVIEVDRQWCANIDAGVDSAIAATISQLRSEIDHPCPNGKCEHAGHFHDIDTYEDPRPMCVFEDCPCGKPTTAHSTEAVGEGRRDKPELIVAAIQENLRAIGEDSLTGLGWLPPAAHVQLRSDLSAMTSDRDWLRGELDKAAAEIAELRALVLELIDDDECVYDHHRYCQTHSLHAAPCPHARAKALFLDDKED